MAMRLRHLRYAAGIGQQDLASAAGVSRSTIANIERGEGSDIKLSNLLAIAGALGTDLSGLVGGAQSMPADKIVAAYLQSPLAEEQGLTHEERAWLQSLPTIVWRGKQPSYTTIFQMVEAIRNTD